MAGLLDASPSRVRACENGNSVLTGPARSRLLALEHDLPSELMRGLAGAVDRTALPRALSRGPSLRLQAVSPAAIAKRPSIVDWIGSDLAPIACGVLEEILGNLELRRAIAQREVCAVVTTTRSVLRTAESDEVGTFRTTISYFFHDGTLYSDAIAVPVSPEERIGWTPILVDELGSDLFGDAAAIEAGMQIRRDAGRKSD